MLEIKNAYSQQPILINEICYEDSEICITKEWTWNINSVHTENETDILTALLCGEYINGGGKSTFVAIDGKRLTDLEFDYIGDFEDDMWLVGINGQGYGFLNKDIELVVPTKYRYANNFSNGYASVHNGKEWLFVDKKGKELLLENKYERLGNFSDELSLVSTMEVGRFNLAYHSVYDEHAGCWGYVDKNGKEIIKPQYIYAFDFINDRAIVAKGKWTKSKKWDNEYRKGCYWSEEELWGVIDGNGNEIIPCIYDEIKQFTDNHYNICTDYYIVHVGGWKSGKWAILDRYGNFLTEPVFEDVYYDYFKGMFTYRESATWDDIPLGIYDLNENRILFTPQFDDVTFLDDGNFLVEVFDETLGYKIEKIIDRNGKDIFKSDYTSIYTWETPYLAIKENKNSTIYNYIDKKGNIVEGNEFKDKISYWDRNSTVNFKTKTYIYSDNNKFGLKNFDNEIIIPAEYEYFVNCRNNRNLYYFKVKKDSDKEGLMKSDGTIILEPKYHSINVYHNNTIICNGKDGVEVYEYKTSTEVK